MIKILPSYKRKCPYHYFTSGKNKLNGIHQFKQNLCGNNYMINEIVKLND